jgi:hypothetical protein
MAHLATTAIEWPANVRRASGRTPGRVAARRSNVDALAAQQDRHLRGALAELAAAALLMLKGYRIIERRHRSRSGEIDLIATRGRRIAFVEVKLRASVDAAAASITGFQIASPTPPNGGSGSTRAFTITRSASTPF